MSKYHAKEKTRCYGGKLLSFYHVDLSQGKGIFPFGFSLLRHFLAFTFKLLIHFVWLRITDDGLVPEMRIWSILVIKSDIKWCIHFRRSLLLYYHCPRLMPYEKNTHHPLVWNNKQLLQRECTKPRGRREIGQVMKRCTTLKRGNYKVCICA